MTDSILKGKVLYAFGDSIVDGHYYTKRSCVNVVADNEGMTLVKRARNGATIRFSTIRNGLEGQILQQAEFVGIDQPKPDVILFNGGANDAWPDLIPAYLGAVSESKDPAELDLTTYAGCFEATILAFRRHWPDTPIVYLAVAKIGRDWAVQNYLRQVQLAACKKWGVTVADVFGETDLDARNEDMRVTYSFDMLGTDGLPGTPETATYPDPDVHPSGTHPNFAAIDKYYAPIITKALKTALGGEAR
ncbi:SGNH/GDSL hydrolase family protein [Bifidobacterium vansinderenii]|uniref:GDSL-like Lipase/Acylhydrolase family n=1 Tax=Bifidobacterium vansinderenii TaxID=1984871 RepID=A0A229VWB5_9BIFI|nr:SGNH/GDSL hydrolase family protein [Bifidobacterium vansinderenii]OXM99825.1 GDSL-like Lipase/Acylhydrolase family [Bifidobacterium vansinderenii]